MLSIKKLSAVFVALCFFIGAAVPVFAETVEVDSSNITTLDIVDFSVTTQTLTSTTGPNTSIPINSYLVDYNDYTERINQFYRYQYRSLFKTSSQYYAYRLTFTRSGTCTTNFTNIPWARLCVGTMDELADKSCVMGSSSNNSFTIWYVSDYNSINTYLAMYMLCNDICRNYYSITADPSVEYFRPQYSFTLNFTCKIEPYYKDDFQEEILSQLTNNGDLLADVLAELENNSSISSDLLSKINDLQAMLDNDMTLLQAYSANIQGILEAVFRSVDENDTLLKDILDALSSTSENGENVDNMKSDDFSSVLGGSMSDGGAAIGSLPSLDIGSNQGGFNWFQKCFTDVFNSMPGMTGLVTTVLLLGFIGFVLGRHLNKG